jgi:glyoxylase-like metal-dependent hydrolase (beta-lactamase superfamily II)
MQHLRSALAVVCLALLGACGPAERAAPEVTLYALDCGRVTMGESGMLADDGSFDGVSRELVDPCYLIRHPDGDLLWDAGLPDAISENPEGVSDGPFNMRVPARLVDQLAQLGLAPSDIEFFSASHSHFDHMGNAALFADSTWIVDADERAWMFREEARAAEEFALVAPLESLEPRSIEGDADFDVFGDGSVTIIQAPGHTPGHTMLLVRLPNAGPVLLTGDMYHLAETRERRLVPTFNVDRAQTLASMDKVERIAAETGARVIRQHVPEDFDALPAFPAGLN